MRTQTKKKFFKASLLALVGAIFLTSFAVVKPTLVARAADDFLPTVAVTYNGTFASSNADYVVTPTDSGIKADSVIAGGWNYSKIDSYVAITATNGKAIATQSNGITLSFSQRTLVDYDIDSSAVDAYEQLITVEGENGETAHICAGGVYYVAQTDASSVYAQTPKSHRGMLTDEEKNVIITIDFVNDLINVYFDGQLAQYYKENNSKYANIVSVVDTFEKVLTKANSTLYLRKPCSDKAKRNTKSLVMGNVEVHNSVFTEEQAAAYYEKLTKPFTVDVNVQNLTSEQFTQTSSGKGFEYNDEREGAFRFTDTSSYLTVTANEGKKLISEQNGVSFHFYQRTTTDVYYKDEGAVRPDATDDFEQLFCVEGANGELAFICTGGLYYLDAEGTRTYAQPTSGNSKLLTTEWKYVSIVLNNVENSVSVYANGERIQYFSPTASKAAVTANVVSLFTSVASGEGGSIYIRRNCPKREDRNSATLILDDIIIANGNLTDAQVLDYYDSALGNARIRFDCNMESADIPEIVVKKGTALSLDILPEIDGYVMEGLFEDKEYTKPIQAGAVINSSCTLYVKYSLIEYTITYHGASVEQNPTSYTLESNGVTIYDAQKEGYIFEGWYRTEKFENQTHYLVPGTRGNIDLYAKFRPIEYQVTYNKNGGVFTAQPTQSFTVESADFALVPLWKAYYDFGGWYQDEQLHQSISEVDTAICANLTVYAKFTPTVYTIEYRVAGGSLSENAVTSYTVESESIELLPASKAHYIFEGWCLDEALTSTITQIDVKDAGDITLYAKYSPVVYTIEYQTLGGTLSENAITSYTVEDSDIKLATASKQHYEFVAWCSDEQLQNAVTEIDLQSAGNITLYAKYSPISYKIKYVVEDGATNENAITSYTVEDGVINLLPASKKYYVFDGWYLDGEYSQAISEIDASKGGDITIYAKFTKEKEDIVDCNSFIGSSTATLGILALSVVTMFIYKKRGDRK